MPTNLIVCDIQPEYEGEFNFTMPMFTRFLNFSALRRKNKIIYFYNGYETLGMIREEELIEWLLDNGLWESTLDKIIFIDKGYGFLRDAMDAYVDDEVIVAGVKELIEKDKCKIYSETFVENQYTLHWNECFPVIESVDNIVFVGGSKFACLLELIYVAQGYDKKYKLLDEYVY